MKNVIGLVLLATLASAELINHEPLVDRKRHRGHGRRSVSSSASSSSSKAATTTSAKLSTTTTKAASTSATVSSSTGKASTTTVAVSTLASTSAAGSTNTPKPVSGDGDWAASVAKAKAFVGKLTIPEKVNLTTGADTQGRCVGNTGTIPRLNFPGFCLQDSPVGIRDADYTSLFPVGVNVASTWDRDLMNGRGSAMGAEFRGKGINVALGPMMNLARNAAAGRNWEGCGADPFLCGVASTENVQGIQSQGVMACSKHWVLNDQEHYRGGGGGEAYSSNEDDRSFHELQAWPFAETIKAGVASVMCAYNRVNQTSACSNYHIINEILKEELDFQGFVLSDWAAITDLYETVAAGTDINMPGFVHYGDADQGDPATSTDSYFGAALVSAVENGTIAEARLDDMVTRLMAGYYKLNQQSLPALNFDYLTENTYLNGQLVNEHVNVQGDHYKIIREIGAASSILLKNSKNALPLNVKKIKQIAIIGSDAGPNPEGPNACGDRACDQGTLAIGWGSGTANFPYLIDPLSAIQNYVHSENPTAVVEYVLDDYNYAQVNATASQADVCLVFANADSGEGYLSVDNNVGDRNNLTLWHSGDQLIANTAAHCANTVVIMHIVGPVIVEPWYNHPNVTAIINAGLPGQETGNAILDVLTGAVNPSGRLVYTMAKQRSDYASDILYTAASNSASYIPQINYTEHLLLDYRWFDAKNIEPRYEFGFGLSYTTFAYSGLSLHASFGSAGKYQSALKASGVQPGGESGLYKSALTASFTVKNTGSYDGNEVSQLYLGFPASAGEPPRVLRGFERTLIKKGKSAKISIGLRVKDISIWDVETQSWVIPTGEFTVYVGGSSRNLPLKKTFVL